jgi:hypothetical protein
MFVKKIQTWFYHITVYVHVHSLHQTYFIYEFINLLKI